MLGQLTQHHVAHNRPGRQVIPLDQHSHADPAATHHPSGVDFLSPGEDAQQRRLAAPVAAHDADPLPR